MVLTAFQPKPKNKTKSKAVVKDTVKLSDKDYDVIFDKTFHDFGQVEEGIRIETTYTLTNIGRAPVQILNCATEGGYGHPSYSKEPIMPGKSTKINSPFYTNGKIGVNNKKFTLTTNGGLHMLYFKCEVIERKTKEQTIKAND